MSGRRNERNISNFSKCSGFTAVVFLLVDFQFFLLLIWWLSSGNLVEHTGSKDKKIPATLVGSWMVETGGDQDQASMCHHFQFSFFFWTETFIFESKLCSKKSKWTIHHTFLHSEWQFAYGNTWRVMCLLGKLPINQSINQSIAQSIDQSIAQSINQSLTHSINQSINQPIDRSINFYVFLDRDVRIWV